MDERRVPDRGRGPLTRRRFLGRAGAAGAGAAAFQAAAASGASSRAEGEAPKPSSIFEEPFPAGPPIRVRPVFTYAFPARAKLTSWRPYGGIQSAEDAARESARIQAELRALAARADFPIEVLDLIAVDSDAKATAVPLEGCDVFLIYAAGGSAALFSQLVASGVPCVMFLRHRSGPYYLWHEIAHWRFLRRNGDLFEETNMGLEDIVVDDYDEVLWRLRALRGLRCARGTKMLAIGGLQAYSEPGQRLGPAHAQEVWGYEIETVSYDEFRARLAAARSDPAALAAAERETELLLARPEVSLETERRFVVNSFLALGVAREFLRERGASNFGFAHCMGEPVIGLLDTPPCLVLSLANDLGETAYCHTDLTHTVAGVLLRWIANRPTFVCNTHFPHRGIFTVAHCAAPRRMDGKGYEPAKIQTHFESDYGAATKVEYRRGQILTVVVPNLRLTKWLGFRAQVIEAPARDACRSQIDMRVDGDFRRLLERMEGFHAQVVYGDYLREVGYALRRLGKIAWENVSEPA